MRLAFPRYSWGDPTIMAKTCVEQVDKTALLSPIRCHQSPRSVPIFPRPIFSGPANWRKGVTAFAQTLSRTTNSRAARSANFALHSRAFTAPAMPTVGQRVCERSQAFSVRLRPILCRICFAVRASRGKPSMSAGRPRPSGASHTGEKSGNAVVTIELELEGKWGQTAASVKSPTTMRHSRRLASFAQPMQTHPKCPKRPFHGDNTGSNPVGDAN